MAITKLSASISRSCRTTTINIPKNCLTNKSFTSDIFASQSQCLLLSKSAATMRRRKKLRRTSSEHVKPRNNWMLKSSRWESSRLKLTRNRSRTQQRLKFILEPWTYKCIRTNPISFSQSQSLRFGISSCMTTLFFTLSPFKASIDVKKTSWFLGKGSSISAKFSNWLAQAVRT